MQDAVVTPSTELGNNPMSPALKWAGTVLSSLAIGGIGWADYRTGAEVWLSIFYVIPVVVGGWVLGRGPALLLALASSVAWFVAESRLLGPTHLGVSLWNAGSRLVIFGALGFLTAMARRDRRTLRTLLERERLNARTDPLTGLGNSRAFHDLLVTEVARSGRTGRPLCLALVDLDDFKQVNDLHGHAAGDELLVAVAQVLRRCLRATDVPVRQGGDEFAVLFYQPELGQVGEVARRLVAEIGRLEGAHPGSRVGASVGVAFFRRPPKDTAELVREADRLMYQAKAEGKGRVCVAALD